MKKFSMKRCLVVLGLYLFFTAIFPLPFTGSPMIAKAASNIGEEQSDIKLNVKSKSLVKDSSYTLKVYNVSDSQKVTYKSSDNSIASVDETGIITGTGFGTTTVTVTVKDGLKTVATLDCEIIVGPAAFSVVLTKSEITLYVGDKTTLTAILKTTNTVEQPKFSSNDSEIASVSIGGKITANKVGVTYIFASIDNGRYDRCKVTVIEVNTVEDTVESTN